MQLSKSKSTRKIPVWLPSIVNHFWYCCSHTKGATIVQKVSKTAFTLGPVRLARVGLEREPAGHPFTHEVRSTVCHGFILWYGNVELAGLCIHYFLHCTMDNLLLLLALFLAIQREDSVLQRRLEVSRRW